MNGNIFNSQGVYVATVIDSSILGLRGQKLYDLKGTAVAMGMAERVLAASPNPQWTEYELQTIDEWIARQSVKLLHSHPPPGPVRPEGETKMKWTRNTRVLVCIIAALCSPSDLLCGYSITDLMRRLVEKRVALKGRTP
jgi:hypothetical protein